MEESRLIDPDHNPVSSELVNHQRVERPVAMKREPCSRKMEVPWCSEETHEKQLKIHSNPVNDHSEQSISSEERKSNCIPADGNFKNTVEAEVSKLVMRLVRHYDQNERETDGAVHCIDGSKTASYVSQGGRMRLL